MNPDQYPRATLLPWLHQYFPYLVYDYLPENEFSDADLNTFYFLFTYNSHEGEDITRRLMERN